MPTPFAFDDIAKLEDLAIARMLKEVDSNTLVIALSASPDALVERILSNMGNRARMIIREEIEILDPQRPGDVEDAQRKMVEIVVALGES